MNDCEDRRLHEMVDLVGMRAHATTVAVLQLCTELRRAGVLEEAAIERIKDAVGRELELSRPRGASKADFDRNLRRRLDDLFAGRAMPDAKPSLDVVR